MSWDPESRALSEPLETPEQRQSIGNVLAVKRESSPNGEGLDAPHLYVEAFEDGSGFVFNKNDPQGPIYLSRHAFNVYQNLLNEQRSMPVVDIFDGELYKDFVNSGIAKNVSEKFGSHILRKKTKTLQHRRFSIWFHISNSCNLSCTYCYIPNLIKGTKHSSESKFLMTEDTIRSSALSLVAFCKSNSYDHLHIKFAGGEPTLAAKEIEISCKVFTETALRSGIEVSYSMLTNGVDVDMRVIELIKAYDIAVSVSIDGAQSSHDRIRFTSKRDRVLNIVTKNGTWSNICDNIELMIVHGIAPYILCTVTEMNYLDCNKLLEYTIGKGIGIRFSLVRDRFTHADVELKHAITEELVRLYEWLGNEMPTNMPIATYGKFAEWNPASRKLTACSTCSSSAAIDQLGNAASCQMRMDHKFGNVADDTFDNIFARIRECDDNYYLTNPEEKGGICKLCDWKRVCAGGCPEHVRLVSKALNVASPWCDVYIALLPVYIRAMARQMKRAIERR